jgi:hypothetical protein
VVGMIDIFVIPRSVRTGGATTGNDARRKLCESFVFRRFPDTPHLVVWAQQILFTFHCRGLVLLNSRRRLVLSRWTMWAGIGLENLS